MNQKQELSLKLRLQIGGFWLSQLIYAAAKLDLADILKSGPKNYNDIAKESETQPKLIYRVLRGLASQGLFSETTQGTFEHTELSRLLISDQEGSLKDLAIFYGEECYLMFEHFPETLKTGTPAFDLKYGEPYFSWVKKHPEKSEIFNRAMVNLSIAQAEALLNTFCFKDIKCLMDVGGGNGYLLAKILQKYPDMNGIVFEQDHLEAEAKTQIQHQEVNNRCRFVGGNFFETIPSEADTYLMKYILHDWDDDKAQTILQNCIRAGGPDTRILVVEQMIPPGNDPLFTKLSDCHMMGMLGSYERTEEEWQSLFDKAGLEIVQTVDTEYLMYVFDLRLKRK